MCGGGKKGIILTRWFTLTYNKISYTGEYLLQLLKKRSKVLVISSVNYLKDEKNFQYYNNAINNVN